MLRACGDRGLLDKTAVSIQGLCHVCAERYTDGLPPGAVYSFTFRDLVRMDNIRLQRRKFALRGEIEIRALRLAIVHARILLDADDVREIHVEQYVYGGVCHIFAPI